MVETATTFLMGEVENKVGLFWNLHVSPTKKNHVMQHYNLKDSCYANKAGCIEYMLWASFDLV